MSRQWGHARRHALVALLVVAGVWQLGGGVYIHAKALLAQYLLERAWRETCGGDRRALPWPWADTWPVARLRAPRLGADVIVLAGASGRTLAFGPGHLDGTVLPGRLGNSVISGHRDTHFSFLRLLRLGDVLEVQRPDGIVRPYRVVDTRVTDARNAVLDLYPSQPELTLVTCYPFGALLPGGSLRYLVTARADPGPPLRTFSDAASYVPVAESNHRHPVARYRQ